MSEIECDRRDQQANRGCDAGAWRNNDFGSPQNGSDPCGVHGSSAAETNHGIVARIAGLFQNVNARRRRHIFVDQPVDGVGGFDQRPGIFFGNRPQRAFSRRHIERHFASKKVIRIEIAENQIRIGHGRLLFRRSHKLPVPDSILRFAGRP